MNQDAPAPTSTLAIVALVAVVVCWPVGLILSIIALVRIETSKGALGGRTLAVVALVLNLLLLPVCGVLAAVAIPSFVKFPCRSKQAEAKSNLRSLYIAELSYRGEFDRYSSDLKSLGFAPMAVRPRYEYVVVDATQDTFVAEARGTSPELVGERWRITNANQLENITNKCD